MSIFITRDPIPFNNLQQAIYLTFSIFQVFGMVDRSCEGVILITTSLIIERFLLLLSLLPSIISSSLLFIFVLETIRSVYLSAAIKYSPYDEAPSTILEAMLPHTMPPTTACTQANEMPKQNMSAKGEYMIKDRYQVVGRGRRTRIKECREIVYFVILLAIP